MNRLGFTQYIVKCMLSLFLTFGYALLLHADNTLLNDDIPDRINCTQVPADGDSKIWSFDVQQPPSAILSSLYDRSSDEDAVFAFRIVDLGVSDTLPTRVTRLIIRSGKNNNTTWNTTIAGARLFDGDSPVQAFNTMITASSIIFDLPVGILTIENQSSKVLTLKIYFSSNGQLNDDGKLAFKINSNTDAFAEPSSSQFSNKDGIDVESNVFTIDVTASRLWFENVPSIISMNTNFFITVGAGDRNKNVDRDYSRAVTLSVYIGSGQVVSSSSVIKNAVNGKCSWNDVRYTALDVLALKADDGIITPALSEGIQVQQPLAWTITGSLQEGRFHHAAALLRNGKVLVVGNHYGGSGSKTTEIFDPNGNNGFGGWTNSGTLKHSTGRLTTTVLSNGDVLVAGGIGQVQNSALAYCEIYDVNGNKWYEIPSMRKARYNHTATLLNDGRVLVTGSTNYSNGDTSCEIYEWLTNPSEPDYSDPYRVCTWREIHPMHDARGLHTATLLQNGKVLVTGGLKNGRAIASCELFDPATEQWTIITSMNFPRFAHTATLLQDGRVLVTGGGDYGDLKSCEIFDPDANGGLGYWRVVAEMKLGRMLHTATLINNGTVLVTGNWAIGQGSTSCEVYVPDEFNGEGSWKLNEPMNYKRGCHTATLLQDGRVLVVGGEINGSQSATPTCEISNAFYFQTKVEREIANQIYLAQNYPNPFGEASASRIGTTVIEFSIPTRSIVTIDVFNILGEHIYRLADNEFSEGTHSVNWDGMNNQNIPLPGGVYFYRLMYGENVLTKRMVLMR